MPPTTVLSTSLRKTFFAWRFILDENILFRLTISYQKPVVFSVSVFCSQIFKVKFNSRPKISLTYAVSIVKRIFGVYVYVNIFYFSLLNLNYWCFTTILWNFQKNWTSGTCWKSVFRLPTLQISAYFAFIFTMGKSENIWFFENHWPELNFLCIGSYDKWFCIKSWQKFANLLLLCKAPSKKKRLFERSRKHSKCLFMQNAKDGKGYNFDNFNPIFSKALRWSTHHSQH